MTKVVYKGIEYRSISCLCKTLGVSADMVYTRIKRGATVEEAVQDSLYGKRLVYKGVRYHSIRDLAKRASNVPYVTIVRRINSGWSIDEAVETPTRGGNVRPHIPYKGNLYTIQGIADAENISVRTLAGELKTMPAEEAVASCKRKAARRDTDLKNRALAARAGVTYAALKYRLNRGASLEEATARHDVGVASKLHPFRGKMLTIREISELTGIAAHTLRSRARRGVQLDAPVNARGEKPTTYMYVYRGKNYKAKELAKVLGVIEETVRKWGKDPQNKEIMEVLYDNE